jgi:hypothetical protein
MYVHVYRIYEFTWPTLVRGEKGCGIEAPLLGEILVVEAVGKTERSTHPYRLEKVPEPLVMSEVVVQDL